MLHQKHARFIWFIITIALFMYFPVTTLAKEERASYLDRLKIAAMQRKINANGYSYKVGHNPAMNYSLDELCGLKKPEGLLESDYGQRLLAIEDLPESFDWRDRNGITPVKDQSSCGGCWAFASCAILEGVIKIKDNDTVDLSEQYLISCNTMNYGCNGGYFDALDMFEYSGAVLENCMPYQARDTACNYSCSKPYEIEGWAYVGGTRPSVEQIKTAIYTYGPVMVSVAADYRMTAYVGGIFDGSARSINHAVTLVGWDDNNGNGYWIMKNSWGTRWGEQGYMRIRYGANSIGEGACYVVYDGTVTPTPTPTPTPDPDPEDLEADFSGTPVNGTAPLTVRFSDDSTGNPTSWRWNFGDGAEATEQNPVHTYSSSGSYTVSLTVRNQEGSDSETKQDYIIATDASDSENIALNKPVRVSSTYQSSVYPSGNAVDGDESTFWVSSLIYSWNKLQYLYVDLGDEERVTSVKIKWSTTNYPSEYNIMYWNGYRWVIAEQVEGTGNWEDITFSTPVNSKYICVYMVDNNSSYYTLYELQVFTQ